MTGHGGDAAKWMHKETSQHKSPGHPSGYWRNGDMTAAAVGGSEKFIIIHDGYKRKILRKTVSENVKKQRVHAINFAFNDNDDYRQGFE